MAFARFAGPSCRSLSLPTACGSGFRLHTIPAPACCLWKRLPYDRARAAVHYDYVSRALVHSLKYGDRLDLAPMMGQWMARAGRELLADADTLIPVPLHWRRQWARRFNQSGALAGAISTLSGVPVAHGGLKRMRASPSRSAAQEPRAPTTCKAPSGWLTSIERILLDAGDVLVFARVVAPARTPI